MWVKVKTLDDLKQLKVGDTLAKYPLEGDPKDEIDINDTYKFQVHSIDNDNIELKFHDSEINKLSELFGGGFRVTGAGGKPAILNKSPEDIIKDAVWWMIR